MNTWRIFLTAVVGCLLTFVLASGVLVQGSGDVGTELAHQAAVSGAAAQAVTPVANEAASVKKELNAVDGNIAASGANLTQATADMKEASSK